MSYVLLLLMKMEEKEIFNSLVKDIKSLKQLKESSFKLILDKYKNLVDQLKQEYNLTDLELAYSIKLDISLEKHVCKTCGKPVGFSIKYKKFKEHCNNLCKAQDKSIKQKRLDTMLEKYGTTGVMNVPELRDRIKTTNLKRYGSTSYFSSIKFKDIQQDNLKNLNLICREKGYEAIVEKAKSINLEPLFTKDEYINNPLAKYDRILKWKCLDCNTEFEAYYANGQLPICHCKKDKHGMQSEVFNYIKGLLSNDVEIKQDCRKIIAPLELDIYIPSLNLAFEFNGKFWHSETYNPDKNYHLNKTKLCEDKNIKLIHIFEWEWSNKQELVKQRIKNALGKTNKRIFARNCIVKTLEKKISDNFIKANHLQELCSNDSIRLGLYYKNELVGVMTFGKPRFNKNYDWELLRFCSNKTIVGGASKLLKYFERNYNPKNLISYANRCWSSKNDNVYSKIGFKLIDESKPGYIYVSKHGDVVLTRYQCQKHRLKDLLGADVYNETLTESDNMLNAGFLKVYDCGQLVFEKSF